MRNLISVLLLLNVCSCGGNSNSIIDISGDWHGQLRQLGGVLCGDGSFLGVGSGVPTREVDVSISGGSDVGDSAEVTVDDCSYQGNRESETIVSGVSSGEDCKPTLEITILDSENIDILLSPAPPSADEPLICVISEEGNLLRS